jgi:hypothetical protein
MGLGGDGQCQPWRLAVRQRTGAAGMTRGCTSFGRCQNSYWRCRPARGAGGGVGEPWRTRWRLWGGPAHREVRCLGAEGDGPL